MRVPPRYTIIIPAHNEEQYIAATLRKVVALDYPAYEVIIVENGSKDATLAVAKRFASRRVAVHSLTRNGVSHAKNFGASKAAKSSEWLVFLDADTLLEKGFLCELDAFLASRPSATIGTTRVRPIERSAYMTFWFAVYDGAHKLFKSSCSIQIARRACFDKVRFDEALVIEEDFKLINDLRRYGSFFYLDTKTVSASARRFMRVGPIRLTIQWIFAAIVPHSRRRTLEYPAIR